MVVSKVKQHEGGALLFDGEAEEVRTRMAGSVGEIAMKTHVERSSRPTVSTIVVGSTKSDVDVGFVAKKDVGEMKGKGKGKWGRMDWVCHTPILFQLLNLYYPQSKETIVVFRFNDMTSIGMRTYDKHVYNHIHNL